MTNIEKKPNTPIRLPVTLEGIVIPTQWDDIGNHTAIALAADDEQEYRINTNNQKGQLLQNHIRTRVKIEGYLNLEAVDENRKVIWVDSFRILDNVHYRGNNR